MQQLNSAATRINPNPPKKRVPIFFTAFMNAFLNALPPN